MKSKKIRYEIIIEKDFTPIPYMRIISIKHVFPPYYIYC